MSQKSNPKENNSWNQLYSNSEQLTKATSVHEVFSEEDITYIENRLKKVLVTFLEKEEHHAGIKIYVDKVLNNKYTEKMALQKPTKEESLKDWCTSIFHDKKFGVVFNSLESYDNLLTERMCSIVKPLLEKAGMPLGGLSFLFFMGNYGFTPFGIHKEAKGEEGFLFHMGPSKKTFYTWDIEEYNAIEHNTQVYHNVEDMLPKAESYELNSKSLMFIPNHLYHIANTEEFSFSVVMDYINPSREFLEKMIAQKITETTKNSTKNSDYLPPIEFNKGLDWDNLIDKSSWEKNYKNTMREYVTILKSNSGVLAPSISDYRNYLDNDFSIKGKKTFLLIEFEDENQQFYVMARGHKIPIQKNSNLSMVLDRLNNGKIISFKELKKTLLKDWEIHHLYEFISNLFQFTAVEKLVVTNAENLPQESS